MSRRWRVSCALAVSVAAAACTPAPAVPAAPVPVVLVSIDTLRADRLNSYGYERRRLTPHLDALARDGVLFESHYSSSPWTTPAHLTMFTGLHPTSHGVVTSFTELMDGLGQLGRAQRLASAVPTLPEVLKAQGRETAAFTGGVTVDPAIGFGRGFDAYDVSLTKMSPRKMAPVEAWIRERAQRPFFLFLHTFEVHAPYLDGRFAGEVLDEDRAAKVRAVLARVGREKGGWKDLGHAKQALAQHQALNRVVCDALYDGGVASVDEYVGRLVAVLREAGVYDRALVVVTSDHGETLGERGAYFFNNHGETLHEEQVRVPLIVKLPRGEAAGRRVRALTRAIDLMPTLLDVVGAPAPDGVQGRSLRPLWSGGALPAAPAILEALNDDESKGIRDDRYKLVLDVPTDHVAAQGRATLPAAFAARRLFDLASDPLEVQDLLVAKSAAPVRLADLMEAELRRTLGARRGKPESVTLDAEAADRLRALGYIN